MARPLFSADKLVEMEQAVMRMLDEFEDVPGSILLKKFLLRPFQQETSIDPKTAYTIQKLRHAINPDVPHKCSAIRVFYVLLFDIMTDDEKARHVAPLINVFKCLVARHRGCNQRHDYCYGYARICAVSFVPFWVKLLREGEDTPAGEMLVGFVECVLTIPEVKLERLLLSIDPNGVDYLFTCFSVARFHACGIRESNFLMYKLFSDNRLSVVLIKHGFKYSFHQKYYLSCGSQLHYALVTYKGLTPRIEPFEDHLMNSGNRRKQLAMEILMHLFRKHWMTRELLCALWSSLPDPFITPDEFYHLMEPNFPEVATSFLFEACGRRYRDLFPGVPRDKQPRSLKHLARVQIRKSMVRANSIGEKAIRSLGLPKTIEDYLWKLEAF